MYFTEGKHDSVFINEVARIPNKKIRCLYGKSEVIRRLAKGGGNFTGIVDEDPGKLKPKKFREFTLLESLEALSVDVRQYRSSGNILIIIKPNLAEWILEVSKKNKIDVKVYGFSRDPTEFHNEINQKLEDFRKLICDLKENSREIAELEKVIRKYSADP